MYNVCIKILKNEVDGMTRFVSLKAKHVLKIKAIQEVPESNCIRICDIIYMDVEVTNPDCFSSVRYVSFNYSCQFGTEINHTGIWRSV